MLFCSAAAGLVPVVTTERSRMERGIMGPKLMPGSRPTKSPVAQIRHAAANRASDRSDKVRWDATSSLATDDLLPTLLSEAHRRAQMAPIFAYNRHLTGIFRARGPKNPFKAVPNDKITGQIL